MDVTNVYTSFFFKRSICNEKKESTKMVRDGSIKKALDVIKCF